MRRAPHIFLGRSSGHARKCAAQIRTLLYGLVGKVGAANKVSFRPTSDERSHQPPRAVSAEPHRLAGMDRRLTQRIRTMPAPCQARWHRLNCRAAASNRNGYGYVRVSALGEFFAGMAAVKLHRQLPVSTGILALEEVAEQTLMQSARRTGRGRRRNSADLDHCAAGLSVSIRRVRLRFDPQNRAPAISGGKNRLHLAASKEPLPAAVDHAGPLMGRLFPSRSTWRHPIFEGLSKARRTAHAAAFWPVTPRI